MRYAAALVVLLSLGGCSWLYQSPYDRALSSPMPVEPPPSSGSAADQAALLPYEASSHFREAPQ